MHRPTLEAPPSDKKVSGPQSIFILVGDQSADKHMAPIIAELRRKRPDLSIWGVGGPEMKSVGMDILHDCRDFAVIGLQHGLKKIPFFKRMKDEMVALIKQRKPQCLFLVDFGSINLRLGATIRKELPNMPIYQFISPQVWASRPWRIKTIKENKAKLLVIFPFEQEYFRSRDIGARFVGHPLIRNLPPPAVLKDKENFLLAHGLKKDKKLIAVFPGSRKMEIQHILPPSIEAIELLARHNSDLQFAISASNEVLRAKIEPLIDNNPYVRALLGERLVIVPGTENSALMANCDFAWAKSGTTTLELTLFGKPMLIYYRGTLLDFCIFSVVRTAKLVGLPNILSQRQIVPELLQYDCNPGYIARATTEIMNTPAIYKQMADHLQAVKGGLAELDYVDECVREILSHIQS